MSRIAADEAKGSLAQLIKESESGQEIVVVNRGEPLARLEAHGPGHDVEQAREAIRRIREYARQHPIPGLTIEEIKSWIDEGRP